MPSRTPDRIVSLAAQLDLTELLDRPVEKPAGQKTRVALARR
jgi:ABC-type transport system involved in cytochrome c biogenesis ATPase subunit